jgi:predicted DNA-binding transcriptional regulator AlpA
VQQTTPDPLLTTAEVAARLRITPQVVREWRYRGRGPSFIRVSSRLVLYRESEIERFLAEREQGRSA